MINLDLSERHPSTRQIARWFEHDHLPEHLQPVAAECAGLAEEMIGRLPDGPELTTGLRKLLEAKDCFVRSLVGDFHPAIERPNPSGLSM
ncbi:MAG TPA: hypothetical protein VK611_21650 [Acidimicrobiales bacterium]|nr:hypothetical protein [Acidimicrobiales bacterium]